MTLDRFIATFDAEPDGDLTLCRGMGVAWQTDREHLVAYDAAYYDKCAGYQGSEIANAITAARIALVARHRGPWHMVDVGIGSGEFVRARGNTFGHDVNPVAIEWLKRSDLWIELRDDLPALSFWDVLEHCPDPGLYLDRVMLHGYLFASVPIFDSLDRIRESKHYRPGEHLYYWTEYGFVAWLALHGFLLLEVNDAETQAGRESIKSFAFKRIAWARSPTSS